MPVSDKHKEYQKYEEEWEKCRDTIAGSKAVKLAGQKYIPKLSGQDSPEYEAYINRALFYSATSRTVQALMGSIFRKEYTLEYPSHLEHQLEAITLDGKPFDSFLRSVVRHVISTGRLGILTDVLDTGNTVDFRAYLALYKTEAVINWREAVVGSSKITTMVVMYENYEVLADDGFTINERPQYRVLTLNKEKGSENIRYMQDVYRKNKGDERYTPVPDMHTAPTRMGLPLDKIPFQFINTYDLDVSPDQPPLIHLAEVNLSHYRTSADLEHGAHFTALPTAWVAGFSTDSDLRIGSATAWVTEEVGAKVGFLEYTGQGLSALRDIKNDKEQLMAILGARLLEENKKAAEAADTLKIRAAGESGSLTAIAKNISAGVEKALKTLAWWSGATDAQIDAIKFELNTDFIDSKLTPQEIAELTKMYQSGAISQDTFLYNLKRGEILPEDISIEDEKSLIDTQGGGIENDPANIIPMKRNFSIESDDNGKPIGFKEQ